MTETHTPNDPAELTPREAIYLNRELIKAALLRRPFFYRFKNALTLQEHYLGRAVF